MDKEEDKKYEYVVERVKRKLTKSQKISIIIAIILFCVLIIPRVFNSALTAKQDGFLSAGRNIEKYVEYNYMNCKNNKEYDKEIFKEDCTLNEEYSKKIIINSGYEEEDIESININIDTRKMRLVPSNDGFYAGTTIIELDLHID